MELSLQAIIQPSNSDEPLAIPSTLSSTAPPHTNPKTRLCRYFLGTNVCKFKEKCQFAHNPNEIKDSKQRLLETCKYALDLGILNPTFLQARIKLRQPPQIQTNTITRNFRPQLQEDSMKKIANHLNPEPKLETPDHTQKINKITMQSLTIMEPDSPPAICIISNTSTATLNSKEIPNYHI